jgi:PAS domain S-box-containing protein
MHTSIETNGNIANRYEALFRNATMGIVVVNYKGSIQSVNPFALKLFGFTKEELLGKPIELLIPWRYHQDHQEHRKKYAGNPENRPMGHELPMFAVTKEGKEFPVEISLGYYENKDDKNVFAFINDITERRKAQADIMQLNEELEAIVEQRTLELRDAMRQLQQSKEELFKLLEKEKDLGELKSRFLSMASHEFKTPLSTVLSSSYLISKYSTTEDQPRRQKHLDRIVSSVTMLTDILNDFLSVGKLEEGKIPVRSTHFNIHEFIKNVAEEIKHTLKNEQQIHCYHKGEPTVWMDASILKHIILNLVSNASKFSEDGDPIELQTTCTKKQITLSVKDHGMGISPGDQQHLMEPFFRGANVGDIQGTGLGLHIVSKYAELLHGKMKCITELKKGTEFIVTFKPKKNYLE